MEDIKIIQNDGSKMADACSSLFRNKRRHLDITSIMKYNICVGQVLWFYQRPYFSPHVRESRTVLDSGFWIPCCGFRILGTGFRIPDSSTVDSGFQKELDSIFFPVLMLFFALRFRVRILLYWKTLLEGITSLFSFSIYKITGINVLQFRKGLWYNNEGDIGGLSTPQHRRKNRHRITAKSSKKT